MVSFSEHARRTPRRGVPTRNGNILDKTALTLRASDWQDGLNLNLVLNGATLLGVIGLGVKVRLAGKALGHKKDAFSMPEKAGGR